MAAHGARLTSTIDSVGHRPDPRVSRGRVGPAKPRSSGYRPSPGLPGGTGPPPPRRGGRVPGPARRRSRVPAHCRLAGVGGSGSVLILLGALNEEDGNVRYRHLHGGRHSFTDHYHGGLGETAERADHCGGQRESSPGGEARRSEARGFERYRLFRDGFHPGKRREAGQSREACWCRILLDGCLELREVDRVSMSSEASWIAGRLPVHGGTGWPLG
jgi:hypothetical protein